jgi:hypothetical protein
MSENSGPGGETNAQKMARIRETQRETARITKPKVTPRGGPGAKIQKTGSLSTAKAVKKYVTDPGKNFKGVGSNFYTPPKGKTGSSTGGGKGDDKPKLIKDATETSVGTLPNTSGLVDDVNFKDEYFAEVKRLVLTLVNNAKDLLMRYNFSSINSITDYYLDADREAISQDVLSGLARPEPPFGPQQALQQEKFSFSVNEINNKINDFKSDLDKINYFGTQRGDTFLPQKVRISSGIAYYDMKFEFSSIYDKNNYVIRCYEIS